ncbi:MAG: hypothetical protein ACXWC8_06975, partial [Limisphaerales bacterium]
MDNDISANKVTPDQLQPGDVLLYHGKGMVSEFIRLFDGSQYSHAALFDGQQVIEAISPGVTGRPLKQSIAGATYVDVYRFISNDGHKIADPGYPAQPITGAGAKFLAQADRYAYEQIVLLAVLAATRRMPVISDIPFLRWMLRNILDNAAEALNRIIARGKEPMICSELVYRCYTQSGPQYDIQIRGADTMAMRVASTPPMAATATTDHDAVAIQAQLDAFLAKYQLAKGRSRSSTTKGKSKRVAGRQMETITVAG